MRYPNASDEPLETIRANECEADPNLATRRFQAFWNEIESRFTREDIEGWLRELGEECQSREYDPKYKFGFSMGLTAVMIKLDDARRARQS